ncbi:hypothetical protein [Nesterenkonia ebinurensis]|uniref:hypothetical protein n=1 Tax=Nesterenkonia ebinurensis TaxID=2608252 RepID=UPI00123E1038|nr:hypothetical protein [Nesterenkonia ebinurensis]
MRQVTVMLSDEAMSALDEVVGAGGFASVDEAVNTSVLETLTEVNDVVGSLEFVRFLEQVGIPVGNDSKEDLSRGLSVEVLGPRSTGGNAHHILIPRPV